MVDNDCTEAPDPFAPPFSVKLDDDDGGSALSIYGANSTLSLPQTT